MSACSHNAFHTHARVARMTDGDRGPVVGFMLETSVHCRECGQRFVFSGQIGSSFKEPCVSFDGITLRAPIAPEGAATAGAPTRMAN